MPHRCRDVLRCSGKRDASTQQDVKTRCWWRPLSLQARRSRIPAREGGVASAKLGDAFPDEAAVKHEIDSAVEGQKPVQAPPTSKTLGGFVGTHMSRSDHEVDMAAMSRRARDCEPQATRRNLPSETEIS